MKSIAALRTWVVGLLGILSACATEKRDEAPPVEEVAEAPAPVVEPVRAPRTPVEDVPVRANPEDEILTLSAVGDCTLGDPIGADKAPEGFHKTHDDNGADMKRPFSGVIEVLDADDLTIANLEGTLTTATQRTDVAFSFRGRPEFASMLVHGSVDLVNLSNNHAMDCGQAGVDDTQKSLDAVNVGYFGLGKADVRTVKGIEVHNLGYTGGDIKVLSSMVSAVKKHKREDNLTIVSFHWGSEGSNATNDVQQKLGRAAIDAGADLVLGHHPHVLQGIEDYKGRKIVYSLGNFVFGGNAHPGSFDTMIFQAKFKKDGSKVVALGYDIVPVSISSQASFNDFKPMLLEGAEADRIRSDVEGFSAKLNAPKRTASR